MVTINLNANGDIKKAQKMAINVDNAIELALSKIWLMVQNTAKINSPYDRGTLRRSISTDFSKIKQGLVVVWSPVVYARIREFVNKKNPHTKFYLMRWFTENKTKINQIIKTALKDKLK